MISARNSAQFGGVKLILRSDGSSIHLNDIDTANLGQEILDEIDTAILQIETQLEDPHQGRNADWLLRARRALKIKRRLRPSLQQRIAELKKQESAADRGSGLGRSKAFIAAAKELLDAEVVTEIWARAAEVSPAAFEREAPHA